MTQKIHLDALKTDLMEIQRHCLRKSNGEDLVSRYLVAHPIRAPYAILALGKAACAMTMGAVRHQQPEKCLVITKYQHTDEMLTQQYPKAEVMEAGHPIPDESSVRAGEAIRQFCADLKEEQVLCLISGGASALAELPRPGQSLTSIQRLNQELIASGKPIEFINHERQKYSDLKSGGLARLLKTKKILALYLSDVIGNDTSIIGSGVLADKTHADLTEEILADNYTVCLMAAAAAAEKNYRVRCHASFLNERVDQTVERIMDELEEHPGWLHIWGGEPTIALPVSAGRGGRNQHLALLMAKQLANRKVACFTSLGTDGTDGNTNYAGACVTNATMRNIETLGLDYEATLRAANSTELLEKINATLTTGPTGTNLMDLVLAYCSN